MPTMIAFGKLQRAVSHTFVVPDDMTETQVIAEFKRKYPGVTGIRVKRGKAVEVLTNTPAEVVKAVAAVKRGQRK